MPIKPNCPKLSPFNEDDSSLVFAVTEEEYKKSLATLKNKKAAGIDYVLVEQLKKGTYKRSLLDGGPCYEHYTLGLVLYEYLPHIPPSGTPIIGSCP